MTLRSGRSRSPPSLTETAAWASFLHQCKDMPGLCVAGQIPSAPQTAQPPRRSVVDSPTGQAGLGRRQRRQKNQDSGKAPRLTMVLGYGPGSKGQYRLGLSSVGRLCRLHGITLILVPYQEHIETASIKLACTRGHGDTARYRPDPRVAPCLTRGRRPGSREPAPEHDSSPLSQGPATVGLWPHAILVTWR